QGVKKNRPDVGKDEQEKEIGQNCVCLPQHGIQHDIVRENEWQMDRPEQDNRVARRRHHSPADERLNEHQRIQRVFGHRCCPALSVRHRHRKWRQGSQLAVCEYTQSHGARCAHNHVDGPLAATFSWQSVMQRIASQGFKDKLRVRLDSPIEAERTSNSVDTLVLQKSKELETIRKELARVTKNLSRAKTDKPVPSDFKRI